MKSVLITGGGGFIGGHVVRRCLKNGWRVRVIDDFSTGKRENLADVAKDIELIEGDICDADLMERVAAGVDTIFHIAARASVPRSVEHPRQAHDVNVTGTLNVLLAARKAGVRRIVYSASSSAYGDTPTLPKHEDMCPHPLSPYAVSKLAGEHYCTAFANVYNMQTVSLRYFNVFGPRQDPTSAYAAVIPAFVSRMLRGERPVVYGDGEQSRDFCFIDNVVDANLLAAEVPNVRGEVMNIACGERTTLNGIIAAVNAVLGTDIRGEYKPARAGDVRHSLAALDVAKSVISYQPKILFAEGLRRSIDWYRKALT